MNLQELEVRLQRLIEVRLISALPGQKAEDLLVQKLTGAMRSGCKAEAGGLVAPNVYTLLAHPDSIGSWKKPELLDTLIAVLETAAEQEQARLDGAPSITIAEDASLSRGEFRLIASFRTHPLAETRDLAADTTGTGSGGTEASLPENAFLIVEGVKVFALTEPVINIGRRLDNTLVIDDPRVSRNHAQLRAIKGRFVLFDLNSTGGTFVNGQRANQTVLYPGDVVSLAGVALIFGQDVPVSHKDIEDTSPRNNGSADRPTAVIHPSQLFTKKDK